MLRSIPPLNSLKAFVSTATHLSFSKAAKDLGVTQGAVSKQIKILENFLEQKLIERNPKKILLTEKGKIYFNELYEAFNSLDNASQKIRGHNDENQLVINCPPTFSSNFLIPNISKFQNKYKNIEVNVTAGDSEVLNFANYDVAIRGLKHCYRDNICKKLFNEEIVLIAHNKNKINEFKDIEEQTFLKHTSRTDTYDDFCKSQNLKFNKIIGFEHFFMIVSAVKQNLGIGLVPKFLVERELESGIFYNPFHLYFYSGYTYFLTYPEAVQNQYKVRIFAKWLTEENYQL